MLQCKVCGKNADPMYFCKEHFCCEVCGTKENLCIRRGGVICDTCHDKKVKIEVEEFDGETDLTQEIVCPWCGDIKQDSWEAPDEDTRECGNCGNEFSYIREVEVRYSTEKISNS